MLGKAWVVVVGNRVQLLAGIDVEREGGRRAIDRQKGGTEHPGQYRIGNRGLPEGEMTVGGELHAGAIGGVRNPARLLDTAELAKGCRPVRARQEAPSGFAMLGEVLFVEAVLLQRRTAWPGFALSGRRQVERPPVADPAIDRRPALLTGDGDQRGGGRVGVINRADPQAVDVTGKRRKRGLQRGVAGF